VSMSHVKVLCKNTQWYTQLFTVNTALVSLLNTVRIYLSQLLKNCVHFKNYNFTFTWHEKDRNWPWSLQLMFMEFKWASYIRSSHIPSRYDIAWNKRQPISPLYPFMSGRLRANGDSVTYHLLHYNMSSVLYVYLGSYSARLLTEQSFKIRLRLALNVTNYSNKHTIDEHLLNTKVIWILVLQSRHPLKYWWIYTYVLRTILHFFTCHYLLSFLLFVFSF